MIHNDTRELGKTKLMKMQQVASFLFVPSFTVRYTTSISNTVYQNTNSHSWFFYSYYSNIELPGCILISDVTIKGSRFVPLCFVTPSGCLIHVNTGLRNRI